MAVSAGRPELLEEGVVQRSPVLESWEIHLNLLSLLRGLKATVAA
jgi:hypothetical protein